MSHKDYQEDGSRRVTVGELKADLLQYPDDMPVFFHTDGHLDMYLLSVYDEPEDHKLHIDVGE